MEELGIATEPEEETMEGEAVEAAGASEVLLTFPEKARKNPDNLLDRFGISPDVEALTLEAFEELEVGSIEEWV